MPFISFILHIMTFDMTSVQLELIIVFLNFHGFNMFNRTNGNSIRFKTPCRVWIEKM